MTAEVSVMDEFRGVRLRHDLRNCSKQRLSLYVASSAETGRNGVQVGVVIAGVTAKLEGAVGGKSAESFHESVGIQLARRRDANGAIGGEDVAVTKLGDALEARPLAVE